MGKRWVIAAVAVAACNLGVIRSQTQPAPSDPRAIVSQYCLGCHNERLKTGGLVLEGLDLANPGANAEVWEKVIRKVRVGMMPPQTAPRPDDSTRRALIAYLETALDRTAAAQPNPGGPLVHRLNRAEYANAIRDLLDLRVDAAALLPPDDSAFGFDNIAEVLGASPVLMERYVSAAGRIASLAVGDPDTQPAAEVFRIRQDASQDVHIEGLPPGTEGGLLARTTLPLDGEYTLQVKYFRTNLGAMRGLEHEHQIEIAVDGERVHLATLGGDADFRAALENITAAADAIEARSSTRVKLKAGPHQISVAFLRRGTQGSVRLQPFVRSSNDTLDPAGHPHIESFTITGPFNPGGPGDTPSRRRIFLCRPPSAPAERECVERLLSTLAHRAYRGLETPADLARLMEFYDAGRGSQGDFERGVQRALERILASPKFLLRVERAPESFRPGQIYQIGDLELASQLSFFLWSSIPDDTLLELAAQNRLHEPEELERQVRRMLADPKSRALVENFAGQWLYLRNLRGMVPNSLDFPDFDDNLRQAFLRETELFFESIMREDRNVLDLMTADYTFLNERLAKHYGIQGIYGGHFRRVTLQDPARYGILGKGSTLMVTSHTDRTSPVVRGKWILDNLLGAPPPPMPANVPPLDENNRRDGRVLTMRERLELHRANPVCASCHQIMDPIGFALENFDAVGAWRGREGGTGGTPIDAQGQLLDGTSVSGPVELRQALLRQPEIFVGMFVEKMLIYALGRGLSPSDMPVVRGIVREAARQDYRFSSIVLGIVRSQPFQMRMRSS
jgi:mono/diheme cytochrome c family protein